MSDHTLSDQYQSLVDIQNTIGKRLHYGGPLNIEEIYAVRSALRVCEGLVQTLGKVETT